MRNEVIKIQAEQFTATLTTYLLDNSREIDIERKRPLIIICPGGGYRFVSDRESEAVAIQMNAMGFHACILNYSIHPAEFPIALTQLAKSVAYAREHAMEWNVNTDKIIVTGFSAGGHLAASLGVFWHEDFLHEIMRMDQENYRPNGMILSYPVITSGPFAHRDSFVAVLGDRYDQLVEKLSLEHQISENTPPAFVWHTFEDDVVPVQNALLFVTGMREKNRPFELHIYPKGGHGLSLANEETESREWHFGIQEECQTWITMAGTWVRKL
ncbi:MAG: acetyl esterase family enzyme [Herbinix sp.]|jgi:acetyl esterase/lipase|nr:acetyl esterase family enzyme [Herbinix sp.]